MKKLTKEEFSHRVGETFTNKNGESCKIVEYFNATNCTIEFEDGCVIKNRWYANIVKGAFRNPNLPTYYGVGFQVYKVAKEDYIRHVANKWKNQITEECYQALLNYKIEITD